MGVVAEKNDTHEVEKREYFALILGLFRPLSVRANCAGKYRKRYPPSMPPRGRRRGVVKSSNSSRSVAVRAPSDFFLNHPLVPASVDQVEVHALHAARRVGDEQRGVSTYQVVQLNRTDGAVR